MEQEKIDNFEDFPVLKNSFWGNGSFIFKGSFGLDMKEISDINIDLEVDSEKQTEMKESLLDLDKKQRSSVK